MSLQNTSSQQTLRPLEVNNDTPRLQGRTLIVARGLWFAGVIAVLALFLARLRRTLRILT